MKKEQQSTGSTDFILSRLIMGIGDVSDITGVSPRQIRYWEAKKLICSTEDSAGSNRKYDYINIEKVVLLKDYLDQGYTLEAAARHLDTRTKQLNRAISDLSGNITQSDASSQDIKRQYTINNETYTFVAFAVHYLTKERLRIFAPQNGTHEGLMAVPISLELPSDDDSGP